MHELDGVVHLLHQRGDAERGIESQPRGTPQVGDVRARDRAHGFFGGRRARNALVTVVKVGNAGKSLAVVSLLIGIMAGVGRSNFVPVIAGAGFAFVLLAQFARGFQQLDEDVVAHRRRKVRQ